MILVKNWILSCFELKVILSNLGLTRALKNSSNVNNLTLKLILIKLILHHIYSKFSNHLSKCMAHLLKNSMVICASDP